MAAAETELLVLFCTLATGHSQQCRPSNSALRAYHLSELAIAAIGLKIIA